MEGKVIYSNSEATPTHTHTHTHTRGKERNWKWIKEKTWWSRVNKDSQVCTFS